MYIIDVFMCVNLPLWVMNKTYAKQRWKIVSQFTLWTIDMIHKKSEFRNKCKAQSYLWNIKKWHTYMYSLMKTIVNECNQDILLNKMHYVKFKWCIDYQLYCINWKCNLTENSMVIPLGFVYKIFWIFHCMT